MTDNKNVVPYPSSDEEKAGRVIAEAERLSRQSALERTFWMKRSAERLGINVEELKILVEATVKEREKRRPRPKPRSGAKSSASKGSARARRKSALLPSGRKSVDARPSRQRSTRRPKRKRRPSRRRSLTSPNCRWRSTRRSLCNSPPSLISTFISFVTSFQS